MDLTNNRDKFLVSWVTIKVISHAITEFVQAWNHHRISGSTGAYLAGNNRSLTHIPQRAVPQTEETYFKGIPIYKHYVKEISLQDFHPRA